MPGIVEFPQLVQRAVEGFGDLFYGDPQRRHLAEYLTGLFIADRKTVSGINREFARTTDQSCLNRFLTEVDWDVEALNERRLDFLQQDPAMCYSEQGVIAIDNVLIDHTGKCIEDVGWFWDHAVRLRRFVSHAENDAFSPCTMALCSRGLKLPSAAQQNRPRLSVRQICLSRRQAGIMYGRLSAARLLCAKMGEGQTRQMYLVMLAYSLLMSQLRQGRAQEWALCRLTTIGESCRAMLRETLRTTIRWAIDQATRKSRDHDHIITQLAIS